MDLLKKEKEIKKIEKEKKLNKLKEIFKKNLKKKYIKKLKNAKNKKNLFEENNFILIKSKLKRVIRKIKRISRKNANDKFYYNQLRQNLSNSNFPFTKKENFTNLNFPKNEIIQKTEEEEFTLSSVVLLLYKKINKKILSENTCSTNNHYNDIEISKNLQKFNLNKNIFLNLNILTTKATLDNSGILKDFLKSAFEESKISGNVKIEDANNYVKIKANVEFCNDYYEENFTIKLNVDIIITIILLDKIDNVNNFISENELLLRKFSCCLILFDVKKSNENNLIKLESIIKASSIIKGKFCADIIKFNKKIYFMNGKDRFGYEETEYSKNFLTHLKRNFDVVNTFDKENLTFINDNYLNNHYHDAIKKQNIKQINNFFKEFIEFDEYPQFKIISQENFVNFFTQKISNIFYNLESRKSFCFLKEKNDVENEFNIFEKKLSKKNEENDFEYFIDNNKNINYPKWITFFLFVKIFFFNF